MTVTDNVVVLSIMYLTL